MPVQSTQASREADAFRSRIRRFGEIGAHEAAILEAMERAHGRQHRPRTRLLADGVEVGVPFMIITGWACRIRYLGNGRRQVISILLPGDSVGLSIRGRPVSTSAVLALTAVKTADASALQAAWRNPTNNPGLAAALDLSTAEDEALLVDHVVRLGRQTAYERLAHLFLELNYRLSNLGLVESDSFDFPLTQETLGDMLGLSVVHVNRTLQVMRRQGMVVWAHGRATLLDLASLQRAAQFRTPR